MVGLAKLGLKERKYVFVLSLEPKPRRDSHPTGRRCCVGSHFSPGHLPGH